MPTLWRYIFLVLAASVLLVFLAAFSLTDDKLHLVFCDVGQGDAAFIYRGNVQILVDGGPDSSVLSCLSKHMPFWDREIEVVTMTHPQEDHYGGLVDVVRRYKVGLFMASPVGNDTVGFKTLKKEIEDRRIRVMNLKTGDVLRNGLILIETVWPSVAKAMEGKPSYSMALEDKHSNNASSGVLGAFTTTKDLNEFSIVQKISYGDFDVLLTGDIEPPVTETIAEVLGGPAFADFGEARGGWEVLKVPHHGSKNGLTENLLEAVGPKLAVISVGKKNRYGHPNKETIRILGEMRVLRTDLDGEIEIVTDGKKWGVKSKNKSKR